jgi:hypothetical protein
MTTAYCCEMMRSNVDVTCPQHPDRFDCPDCLVATLGDGSYGIIIHDGARSVISINHCPWCGTKLPEGSP